MNSDQINDLSKALADAQAEFPTISKTKEGKVAGQSKRSGQDYEFTYQYADLADVLSAVRPVLSKHGLAIAQLTEVDEASVMYVRTRLMHASGQWIDSAYPVCSINADHQKMGGALTYARRYSLCSLLGVAAEDDLDGQSAGTVEAATPRAARAAASKPAPVKTSGEFERATIALGNAPDKASLKALWDAIEWPVLDKSQTDALTRVKDDRLKVLNRPGGTVVIPPNFDDFPGDLPLETRIAATP